MKKIGSKNHFKIQEFFKLADVTHNAFYPTAKYKLTNSIIDETGKNELHETHPLVAA